MRWQFPHIAPWYFVLVAVVLAAAGCAASDYAVSIQPSPASALSLTGEQEAVFRDQIYTGMSRPQVIVLLGEPSGEQENRGVLFYDYPQEAGQLRYYLYFIDGKLRKTEKHYWSFRTTTQGLWEE